MVVRRAWFDSTTPKFVEMKPQQIVDRLTSEGTSQRFTIEKEQQREWERSVNILQGFENSRKKESIHLLKTALSNPELEEIQGVVLEYDFRRRGLRMDCILFAPGVIFVIEFKRNKITQNDRNQVTNYCINLAEFHDETIKLLEEGVIMVPILCLTDGNVGNTSNNFEFASRPYDSIIKKPLECDNQSFEKAMIESIEARKCEIEIDRNLWIDSEFSPSSNILDAAISLYGQHDVSAIKRHSSSLAKINSCVEIIKEKIRETRDNISNSIIMISGAPGAGKTLVGLNIAFDEEFRSDSIFVTGNAPLVEVLNVALKNSYKRKSSSKDLDIPSGYAHSNVKHIIENSDFKIVSAHRFLKERGSTTNSNDGKIIVFDEAQRTYKENTEVGRERLPDHEANLILSSMDKKYPQKGCCIVALIGHNQVLTTKERGVIAWFEAAEKEGWKIYVADETLQQKGFFVDDEQKNKHENNSIIEAISEGHLSDSMRYYRNQEIENWIHFLMTNEPEQAKKVSNQLDIEDRILISRSIDNARKYVREKTFGSERMGLLASSGGKRLVGEGIYVIPKAETKIPQWMLTSTDDIRSSNLLDSAVTEFKIQGLEIDYSIVCWDADLRIENGIWKCYRIAGKGWQNYDAHLTPRKNAYRVLLTRARKGMVIYVPEGDKTGLDPSRNPEFYDSVYDYLIDCGAVSID